MKEHQGDSVSSGSTRDAGGTSICDEARDDLTDEQRERLRTARAELRARAATRPAPRMVKVPGGPYDEVYWQGVAALNADCQPEELGNPGRPDGLPLTQELAAHLRDRAESSSDGLWVNPAVLVALLDVYQAACAAHDRESEYRDAVQAQHDAIRAGGSGDAEVPAKAEARQMLAVAAGELERAIARSKG